MIKFLKTHEDAVLPKKNNADPSIGDSGYDMTAVEETVIPARGSAVVPVGLTLAYLSPEFWIRIESRSGLAFKNNITAFNGIIDNPYRGDLGVKLFNHSDADYTVKKGDRCAQLVIYPLVSMEAGWTDSVSETSRGAKGFGSSGK
jgi:dUTP pyrophosphatase